MTEDDLLLVSKKAAVALAVSAFILIPFVLSILAPWKLVRKNILFIFGSLAVCVGPSVGVSFVSYEFPSLIGGMIGCFGTALLIKFRVGLTELDEEHQESRQVQDIGSVSVSETSLVRRFYKKTSNVSDVTGGDDGGGNSSQQRSNYETVAIPGSEAEERSFAEEKKDDPSETFSKLSAENDETPGENGDASPEETVPVAASLRDAVDEHLGPRKSWNEGYLREVVLRTFPITAVVLILILTRVEQIGIKEYLTKLEPNVSIHFGTYGTFRLSVSVVLQLQNILTYPSLNWKYELLYLPFIMPFMLVSAMTMFIFRKEASIGSGAIARIVAKRLANPAIALLGALVLVQLMIRSGTAAPGFILGNVLADWFQEGFVVIAPLLGALGSFFSGSTTVSNLTFGSVAAIAAESIGTSVTSMLALQAAGASAGNGICLNNIIAACAVVGLDINEGKILMKTYKYVFANTTIATVSDLRFTDCMFRGVLFADHLLYSSTSVDCHARFLFPVRWLMVEFWNASCVSFVIFI